MFCFMCGSASLCFCMYAMNLLFCKLECDFVGFFFVRVRRRNFVCDYVFIYFQCEGDILLFWFEPFFLRIRHVVLALASLSFFCRLRHVFEALALMSVFVRIHMSCVCLNWRFYFFFFFANTRKSL